MPPIPTDSSTDSGSDSSSDSNGECDANPGYMRVNCAESCGVCSPTTTQGPSPQPTPNPEDATRLEEAENWYATICPKDNYPDMPTLSAPEIMDMLDGSPDSVLLVDMRQPNEQEVSMIKGAITLDEFEVDPDGLGQGKAVVLYCTIGCRSSNELQRWLDMGYQNMYNFRLSIIGWAHAGGEFVDPVGETVQRVFAYASTGRYFPVRYEVVDR